MTDPAPEGTAPASLEVFVNGAPRPVTVGSTALDLVTDLGMAGRPMAVEINEAVVPRAALGACILRDGDRLEIVTLVGGG
jgi:thiamine biosynthesis protein ThiS